MPQASFSSGHWDVIVARLSRVADLEATARHYKALQRVGKITSAVDLLRLALMYGPGHLSLRGAAAAACGVIADISDKAVEGRLRKCGDWLQALLERLLSGSGRDGALALSLIDGSVISAPGGGPQWRLHARYDPAVGRFGDISLTACSTAEAIDQTRLESNRLLIADRGYARVRNFRAVLDGGSDFITRLGWRSVKLHKADGTPFDLAAHWPCSKDPVEYEVHVKDVVQPLRLIMQCLPVEKAARNEKKAARKSASSGHEIDPRTRQAAQYIMVLTSLAADAQSATRVLDLYRTRWQVELSFKRLKSLGGIDKLPAANPKLARTWLLAHLIVAVLTDELANQIVGFSPPTAPCATDAAHLDLARLGKGAPDHHPRHHATAT